MKKILSTLNILALSILVTSCGGGEDIKNSEEYETYSSEKPVKDQMQNQTKGLVFYKAIQWPLNPNGNTEIKACWVNPEPRFATERNWVRQSIAATWEANSSARVVGWDTCSNNENDQTVKIIVDDVNPAASYFTQSINGVTRRFNNVIKLNFVFALWGPSCAATNRREGCIRRNAVHEFGHMLGIYHEHNRDDTSPDCRAIFSANAGSTGGNTELALKVGNYDPYSIMNYCSTHLGLKQYTDYSLSPGDIATIQFLFPLREVTTVPTTPTTPTMNPPIYMYYMQDMI